MLCGKSRDERDYFDPTTKLVDWLGAGLYLAFPT
jgi:hypothetical protein